MDRISLLWSPAVTDATPAAGWYPDPERPNGLRYWDGLEWTEHRSDADEEPQEFADGEGAAASPDKKTRSPRRFIRRFPLTAAAAIAFLSWFVGIGMGAAGEPSNNPPTEAQPTTTITVTATPTENSASVAAALAAQSPTASASAASGDGTITTVVASVVDVEDGDTLRVSINGTTEPLRIIGIDAPELADNACFAKAAASKLRNLVESKSVHISADPTQADRDGSNRILRHVWTSDGTNVARELIQLGLAKEFNSARAYFGQASYQASEKAASADKLGVWSGTCDVAPPTGSNQPATQAAPLMPQKTAAPSKPAPPATKTTAPKTTAPKPAAPMTTAPSTSGCKIKGNISSKGEKIYHMPGQRYYDATKIDLSKGERWFCSEADAVAAGWRKAKV